MTSFLPSHNILITLSNNKYTHSTGQGFKVRAQRFRDEGRSSNNLVDANLRLLRDRIDEIKMKERLERCCRCEYGWNYTPGYNYKLKKDLELKKFIDLVVLACGTVGFTCLGGTILLGLVSLLIRFNQLFAYLPSL